MTHVDETAPPPNPARPPPEAAPGARGPRLPFGTRTLVVVGLLVALELVLRQIGRSDEAPPRLRGIGHWTVSERSARYGWVMLPDQRAWSRDLTIPERINDHGFRDRDWDPPRRAPDGSWVKDATVFRVAMVGNSMTYGTSVAIEDTFGRVLEGRLQQVLDARGDPRRALVMNFAVQGYVFEQMTRVYEDIIRRWRPDVLVVPFHPHDIMPMRPASDDADYDLRRLVIRTATFEFLDRVVIDRWLPPVEAPDRGEIRRWDELDRSITEQPFSRDNRPYWDAAIERMDGIRRDVEAGGGRLVIMSLPRWRKLFQPGIFGAESKWIPWAQRHPGVIHVHPMPTFHRLMEGVVAEIRRKGIPADTTHDLSTLTWTDEDGREHPGDELDRAGESLFLLHDTGHYTARGHAVLGDALFEALAGAGMP